MWKHPLNNFLFDNLEQVHWTKLFSSNLVLPHTSLAATLNHLTQTHAFCKPLMKAAVSCQNVWWMKTFGWCPLQRKPSERQHSQASFYTMLFGINSRGNKQELETLQPKCEVGKCSHNPLCWVCCGSKRNDQQDEHHRAPLDIVQPVH